MQSKLIYAIDDIPPIHEGFVLGLQQYLTMFGSTVAIPLLMAESLGSDKDPVARGILIGRCARRGALNRGWSNQPRWPGGPGRAVW